MSSNKLRIYYVQYKEGDELTQGQFFLSPDFEKLVIYLQRTYSSWEIVDIKCTGRLFDWVDTKIEMLE